MRNLGGVLMLLGTKDYIKLGDHNAWCDRCGFKFKASELVKTWEGFRCCKPCDEPRNEQDFIRSMPEKPTPPWSRPRSDTEPPGPMQFTEYGPVDWSKL